MTTVLAAGDHFVRADRLAAAVREACGPDGADLDVVELTLPWPDVPRARDGVRQEPPKARRAGLERHLDVRGGRGRQTITHRGSTLLRSASRIARTAATESCRRSCRFTTT